MGDGQGELGLIIKAGNDARLETTASWGRVPRCLNGITKLLCTYMLVKEFWGVACRGLSAGRPVTCLPAGHRVVVKIRNHRIVLDFIFFLMKPLKNAFSNYLPVNGFFAVG